MSDRIQYAVLGHPIGHSLSPAMHNAAFKALGLDAEYNAIDITPENLMHELSVMHEKKFGGVNLTIPLKETAFHNLKNLDDSARRLGAVNTVEFLKNDMRGYNTDGYGFLHAIKEAFNITAKDLSVFILGSGGAGRAVAITCANEGAGQIILTDIQAERSQQLLNEMSSISSESKVKTISSDLETWKNICKDADLIVQATPVGMKENDPSLLDSSAFTKNHMVFDLIYMYPETVFMKAAKPSGAKTANGLGMLLHQGARAFSIWTGKEAPVSVMRDVLEKEVYGKKSVVSSQ